MITPNTSDWSGASSFKRYVIHLCETGQTRTDEFLYLLHTFGRDHLKEIWLEYKGKARESQLQSGQSNQVKDPNVSQEKASEEEYSEEEKGARNRPAPNDYL